MVQGGAWAGIGFHCSNRTGKALQFAAKFSVEQFTAVRIKVEAPAGNDVLSQPYLIGGGTY